MAQKRISLFRFILGAWILFLFIPGFSKLQELIAKRRELDAETERIKKANRELIEEYQSLKDDPVYIEKVAREKLGVTQKGEIIYKIPISNPKIKN